MKPENDFKREARSKKTPERFANAIPESILDSLKNDSNLEYSFFRKSPKKIKKFKGPSSLSSPQSLIRQLISSNLKADRPTNQNGVSMETNQITENKIKPTQEDLKMVKSVKNRCPCL